MSLDHLMGWHRDDRERDRVWSQMPTPFFYAPAPDPDTDAFNHEIVFQLLGDFLNPGPQAIGDCVSWGWGHLTDFTQLMMIADQIDEKVSAGSDIEIATADAMIEYQETCTEATYALSRVEVGGRRLGRSDGSLGAWAAEAAVRFGSISRIEVAKFGFSPNYSGQRANEWGYDGLPDLLEPAAKMHTVQDATPVLSFNSAAWHLQNRRGIAICSDVGFENGPQGTTLRDKDGFASPRGKWPHCMFLMSVRMGRRPGCLCVNQWPAQMVQGPEGPTKLPPCSWWIDADVVDLILKQNDSYTVTGYKGYPARKLTWRPIPRK